MTRKTPSFNYTNIGKTYLITTEILHSLTYHSELCVGEDSAMFVLCYTLVYPDVSQLQAADGQDPVVHLHSVLKNRHLVFHLKVRERAIGEQT